MNFFDTVAGQTFAQHTVPELVRAVEEMTEELKKNNALLKENIELSHAIMKRQALPTIVYKVDEPGR